MNARTPLIVLLILFLVPAAFGQNGPDTLYARFVGDTLTVYHIGWHATCGSKWVKSMVHVHDTIAITYRDTSNLHMHCLCEYSVITTVVGLTAGTYKVMTFMSLPVDSIIGGQVVQIRDAVLFMDSLTISLDHSSLLASDVSFWGGVCGQLYPDAVASAATIAPETFHLLGNYPNPFNPTTRISYDLSIAATIRLMIVDALGREITVVDAGRRTAGRHDVTFDAGGLSTGIYFCTLEVGAHQQTRRLILIR